MDPFFRQYNENSFFSKSIFFIKAKTKKTKKTNKTKTKNKKNKKIKYI